jgi:hypothetical protein
MIDRGASARSMPRSRKAALMHRQIRGADLWLYSNHPQVRWIDRLLLLVSDGNALRLRNPRCGIGAGREAVRFLNKTAKACDPHFVSITVLENLVCRVAHPAVLRVQRLIRQTPNARNSCGQKDSLLPLGRGLVGILDDHANGIPPRPDLSAAARIIRYSENSRILNPERVILDMSCGDPNVGDQFRAQTLNQPRFTGPAVEFRQGSTVAVRAELGHTADIVGLYQVCKIVL